MELKAGILEPRLMSLTVLTEGSLAEQFENQHPAARSPGLFLAWTLVTRT